MGIWSKHDTQFRKVMRRLEELHSQWNAHYKERNKPGDPTTKEIAESIKAKKGLVK